MSDKQAQFVAAWMAGLDVAVAAGLLDGKPSNAEIHAKQHFNHPDERWEEIFLDLHGGVQVLDDGSAMVPEVITPMLIGSLVRYLAEAPEPRLLINSIGGDYFAGLAAGNLIRREGGVCAEIVGQAYSAASIIFAGCERRLMRPGTTLGIHGVSTLFYGNVAELSAELDELRGLNAGLADFYSTVSSGKIPAARFAALMEKDTRMNFETARAVGLVDAETDAVAEPPEPMDEDAEKKSAMPKENQKPPLTSSILEMCV